MTDPAPGVSGLNEPEHRMKWDGPFGGAYVVWCSCGWSKNTFAATPDTSIDSTWTVHVDELTKHIDGPEPGALDA